MTPEQRYEEVVGAVREHAAQRLDDRCFLDDEKLYLKVIPDFEADKRLPPREEFLRNCEHYWECRQNPHEKYATEVGTISKRALVKCLTGLAAEYGPVVGNQRYAQLHQFKLSLLFLILAELTGDVLPRSPTAADWEALLKRHPL